MREEGIEPYGGRYERTAMAASIKESFAEMEEQVVRIAGRIMTRRPHGKAGFAHLQDQSGQINCIAKNDLGEQKYELYRGMDIGDIIRVEGKVFKTRTGEIRLMSRTSSIYPSPCAPARKMAWLKRRRTALPPALR